MLLALMSACSTTKKISEKDADQARYLFSWGFQKAKVPKKIIRREFRRLSMSHYYHNETGATPDVVLVGRPPENMGEVFPNLFSLQIYQSLKDAQIPLEPVLRSGEYFDAARSGYAEALPLAQFSEQSFKLNQAYWVRATTLNWGKGKSVFLVAKKKETSPDESFARTLFSHLKKSENIFGTCSDAFVVFVGDKYSVSFLHFENDQVFEKCVFSQEGQKLWDEYKGFMDTSLITEISPATRKGEVAPGEAVKVITK